MAQQKAELLATQDFRQKHLQGQIDSLKRRKYYSINEEVEEEEDDDPGDEYPTKQQKRACQHGTNGLGVSCRCRLAALEEEFAALCEVVMSVKDNAATTPPRETAILNTGKVTIKIEEPSAMNTATATSTVAVTTNPTTPSATPNEGYRLRIRPRH